MRLNRELQYKILNLAADSHPSATYPGLNNDLNNYDEKTLASNLIYLEEQGLIHSKSVIVSIDDMYSFAGIKITKDGLDFLLGDEGLSAILNVVTIRFEAETLKSLIATKINQSDLPPADKKSMIDALEELPAESVKHLTMKLLDTAVDKGMENLPTAMTLIGTFLGFS